MAGALARTPRRARQLLSDGTITADSGGIALVSAVMEAEPPPVLAGAAAAGPAEGVAAMEPGGSCCLEMNPSCWGSCGVAVPGTASAGFGATAAAIVTGAGAGAAGAGAGVGGSHWVAPDVVLM